MRRGDGSPRDDRAQRSSRIDQNPTGDDRHDYHRGRHAELLERCPLYAEIAEHGMEDSVFLQRDLERREEMARL